MVNVMIALRIAGYVLTMYNNRIEFDLVAIFNGYYSDHSMRSGAAHAIRIGLLTVYKLR